MNHTLIHRYLLVTKFKFMRFFVLLTVIVALGSFSPKKGCAGSYYISGTAFSASKDTLKNILMSVTVGDDVKTVYTDGSGHFEFSVHFTNACPSGLTSKEHEAENRRINPAFIDLCFGKDKIRLTNEWKKYGRCGFHDKKDITWNRDLHFDE